MFDFYIEILFFFFVIVYSLVYSNYSSLQFVMLAEIAWILYFVQIHILIKSTLSIDYIFVFLIFLSLITIDLAFILTVLLVGSADTSTLEQKYSGSHSGNNSFFKSIKEGSLVRLKFRQK